MYIGLRDIDRGEKEILRKEGVRAFSMHDIDRFVHSFPTQPTLSLVLLWLGAQR